MCGEDPLHDGIFPFAESIYCARLSSSSQEGIVAQLDANSQTFQIPTWLSFALESKVCMQATRYIVLDTSFICVWRGKGPREGRKVKIHGTGDNF